MGRRHQTAPQRLAKKGQLGIEAAAAAHHQGPGLGRPPLQPSALEQVGLANQTGAAMEPQGFGADQAAIRPSKGLLQGTPIPRSP